MPFVPKILTLSQYNITAADDDDDDDGSVFENLDDFLNSLFDPWPGPFAYNAAGLFRPNLVTEIKARETNTQAVSPLCWLINANTLTLLLDVLEGYWMGRDIRTNPRPRTIAKDEAFIHCIRDYIDTNDLRMRVPSFQCETKRDDEPSTYEWTADTVSSFKNNDGTWNSATVRRFLELFLAGAHFVVVHSATDVGNDLNIPSFFKEFSNLGTKYTGHSHYTDGIALTGVNYPTLELVGEEGNTLDEFVDREQAVLLPVVLSDTTTGVKDHNSFFQMEGWRPGRNMFGVTKYEYQHKVLAAGYRHGADFATHQKTLWNISTYGASLFSEKRGAPVFLAPNDWMGKQKHVYTGFKGSDGGHKWFKSDLVTGLL